jgi:hypothetical protein
VNEVVLIALLGGSARKIIRRIYAAVQIDGIWRRCYNKELCSLFNDVDIITRIKINRLRWAGPEGKRKKARPRMRRMGIVEKDLRNLGVVYWKTKAQERDGWKKFLEQAKTHKGL